VVCSKIKESKMNKGYFSSPGAIFNRIKVKRGFLFGGLIVVALLSFEMFNYSTTEFSLQDLLGDLKFMGIPWSIILAIAFCGIDFAGLARMFTPEQGAGEPNEVWYLLGAWLLAATMNAFLTWWGVSVAMLNHGSSDNTILSQDTIIKVMPIFVAVMVWLIRILIIGTFSLAGDRLFSQDNKRVRTVAPQIGMGGIRKPVPTRAAPTPALVQPSFRPMPKVPQASSNLQRPEPSYHPISVSTGYRRKDPDEPF
jgi:hypothetical protein